MAKKVLTVKVLTVKEVLEQKKIISEKQEKNYYSELLGGEIELSNKINKDDLLEYVRDSNRGEYDRYKEMIYEFCPIFKSEELREAFKDEIDEPADIVEKVFCENINEIIKLGNFILKRFGLLSDSDIEKLKKQ